MKLIFSLLIALSCAAGISAQTTGRARISGNNSATVLFDNARFQIIKFGENSPTSIKLDRFTGKTYMYGTTGGFFNNRRKWVLLSVNGGLPTVPADSVPRYEISEGAEYFFLLNNETGQTWILNQNVWEPVLD